MWALAPPTSQGLNESRGGACAALLPPTNPLLDVGACAAQVPFIIIMNLDGYGETVVGACAALVPSSTNPLLDGGA